MLLSALDRHEAQRRSMHGLAIASASPASLFWLLTDGFTIWRYQPNDATDCRIDIFEPEQHLRTLQPSPDNNLSAGRARLATWSSLLNNTGTLHTTARRTAPGYRFTIGTTAKSCRQHISISAVATIQQTPILEPQPKLTTVIGSCNGRTLPSLHTLVFGNCAVAVDVSRNGQVKIRSSR